MPIDESSGNDSSNEKLSASETDLRKLSLTNDERPVRIQNSLPSVGSSSGSKRSTASPWSTLQNFRSNVQAEQEEASFPYDHQSLAVLPEQMQLNSYQNNVNHGTNYQKVAIFWDLENCPPPTGMPGYVVVENIRKAVHHFGNICLFKAYLEISEREHKKSLRSELQSSGVSLTDCPHNGQKDSADKMILVDMLSFALDNPPPATIVLISGDKDFVYGLATLRNRKYSVVLIVPNKGAPIILRTQASTILEWRYDVLKFDAWKDTIMLMQNMKMQKNNVPTKDLEPDMGDENKEESDQFSDFQSPKAPGFFDVLVEVLQQFEQTGEKKPLRSKVGNILMLRNPLLYQRSGVSSFKGTI
ncbi:NYN, limkain-b1-type domain-containing protein [Rozella allomycis CSF55]|uniref:NYN, limkain-b1-type domain-containing protein n=1 Tax=Rozella allomycis (strain CSF55) TaxID=988480 RepID=A0A075B3H3_ROZAC|nr:NYN, limkain-b1-type domain-containing protein [Rozella allomycis CSF55]|eukprot:EPZ35526.1 NYN, limkain-b1-type domain-containing protein [Rozella allomycis CSF55]